MRDLNRLRRNDDDTDDETEPENSFEYEIVKLESSPIRKLDRVARLAWLATGCRWPRKKTSVQNDTQCGWRGCTGHHHTDKHACTHVRIHDRTHAFLSLASRRFPTRGSLTKQPSHRWLCFSLLFFFLFFPKPHHHRLTLLSTVHLYTLLSALPPALLLPLHLPLRLLFLFLSLVTPYCTSPLCS